MWLIACFLILGIALRTQCVVLLVF